MAEECSTRYDVTFPSNDGNECNKVSYKKETDELWTLKLMLGEPNINELVDMIVWIRAKEERILNVRLIKLSNKQSDIIIGEDCVTKEQILNAFAEQIRII